MNTWNTQWKNQWKKTLALGCAAFLLGGSAWGCAAPTVTAASGAAYAANPQDAPMPLPLTEEEVSAQQLADTEYMALLWMRTSAEYRALCYQGYNAALMAIERAQANPAARSGRFDALWWRATVHEARSEALPGAAEFLREVARRGVAIFYVSNRWSEVNYEPTIENLKALGFPSVDAEHVLLMEDRQMSDKQPRFDRVTEDYDVVVYMGDNVGDLPLGTKGMNRAARNGAIDAAQEEFGTQYIVFPNPAYGSWVSALAKDYMTMSPEAREEFYAKTLTE